MVTMKTTPTAPERPKLSPIAIPATLVRRMKMRAAREDKSIRELVTPCLEELVSDEPELAEAGK